LKSILDPNFRYVPSDQTDIRKTFARVRRELRREAPGAHAVDKSVPAATNVTPLYTGRRSGA